MTTDLKITHQQLNALKLASTIIADVAVLSDTQRAYLQHVLDEKANVLENTIVDAGANRLLALLFPEFYVDDQNVQRLPHAGYKYVAAIVDQLGLEYKLVYNIFNLEAHQAYGSPATVFGSLMEMTVPSTWIHLESTAPGAVLWGFVQDDMAERKAAAQLIQDQQLEINNALTTLAKLQSTLRDLKTQYIDTDLSVRRKLPVGAIVKGTSCSD